MADGHLTPDEPTPDEAALAVVARHALHDEELVAALATGSLDDESEIMRAQGFVDRCSACRDLHRDIAAIGGALRQDARGTMTAPRDFRLTVEDARRLGGPVRVGGFVAAFRRAFTSFAAPVGASMAALGIVGLLVGSVSLGAMSLGGGAAAAPNAAGSGQSEATNAPAGVRPGAEVTGPKATSDLSVAAGPASTAFAVETDTATPRDAATAPGVSPTAWLLGGSVVLLLGGLVLLFVAFRRGRRT